MKKIVFFFFTLLIAFNISAQSIYKPIDTASVNNKKRFLTGFENRYKNKIKQVKTDFSGKTRKLLKGVYKNQFESISRDIKRGELYFDKSNEEYLKKLLRHVVESNPEIRKYKFHVYFSRAATPNAYSIGDGTIVFHIDLFNFIKSEGEFVSILSHEMAHYILNHRDSSIEKYALYFESEEYKQKEKEIRKNRYGKQTRAEKLLKNAIYSRKNKSRKHEYEADSLGFFLFKNTKYDTQQAIHSLESFTNVDEEKDSLNIDFLKTVFQTKNQSFNKDWLFTEDYSHYNYSKEKSWNIDSLKTHPNCENRILRLKELKKKSNTDTESTFSIDTEKFKELQSIAKYESIYNFFLFKEYGTGMYRTLLELKKNPKDSFYLKMFSLFLSKLAEAKKEMKFNSYIPNIDPTNQTNSKQLFINFITNISSNELERLSNDYKRMIK